MSETTNTETTATATIDETLLSPEQVSFLRLAREAVTLAESVKPKSDKRSEQDVLISLVLDGTDEDIKGLSKFREILRAKAAEMHAAEQGAGSDVSDEDRKKIRSEAKDKYDAAVRMFTYFPLPDGFVVPSFPGARGSGGTNAGAGGEKPRNLKHTVTNAAGETVAENVTFAAVSQKIGESTSNLLDMFKAAANIPTGEKVSGENFSGDLTWEVNVGEGENAEKYSVHTVYTG